MYRLEINETVEMERRRKKKKKKDRKEREENASIYTVDIDDVKRVMRKKRKKERQGTYVGVPGFEDIAHDVFFVKERGKDASQLRATKYPEVDKCPICLDEPLDAVFATKCFHTFCGSCILKWLRVVSAAASSQDFKNLPDVLRGVCPLCKYPFEISREHGNSSITTSLLHRNRTEISSPKLSVEFFAGDDNIFLYRVAAVLTKPTPPSVATKSCNTKKTKTEGEEGEEEKS